MRIAVLLSMLAVAARLDAAPIVTASFAEKIQPFLHHVAAETGGEVALPKAPEAVPAAQQAPAAAAPKYIELLFIMREMEFQLVGAPAGAPVVLEAGKKYKLAFENHGQVLHEVLFGRGIVHEDDGLAYSEHLFQDVPLNVWGRVCKTKERSAPWQCGSKGDEKLIHGVKTFGLRELEIDAGLRLAMYVEIPESKRGAWEIGCFAAGHHEAGMRLPLVIR